PVRVYTAKVVDGHVVVDDSDDETKES
ncbi:MAG: hypothetical protein RLZ84_1689, partial [Actinomycetota bacterium]